MKNPFKIIARGVGHAVGGIFGAPIDFLTGKSCKLVWACLSTLFYGWGQVCHILCSVFKGKRRRRMRDIEMADMSSESDEEESVMDPSYSYRRSSRRRLLSREHKRNHMRRSLRARSHRVHVGVDGDSVYATKRRHIKHGDVGVIRSSSFARKGHKRSRH